MAEEDPPSGGVGTAINRTGWVVAGAMVAAAFVLLPAGNTRGTLWFGALGLLSIAVLLAPLPIAAGLRLLLISSLALNAAGWAWKWLDIVPGYDDFAHFLTTAAVVAASGGLLHVVQRRWGGDRRLYFALMLTGGMALGVAWEIYEWSLDHVVVPGGTMDITDTMTDLSADTLGAIFGAFFGAAAFRRPART